MKHVIITAYDACWLEEIENNILDCTHKTAKARLAHLLTQCMKLTNREKRAKIRET